MISGDDFAPLPGLRKHQPARLDDGLNRTRPGNFVAIGFYRQNGKQRLSFQFLNQRNPGRGILDEQGGRTPAFKKLDDLALQFIELDLAVPRISIGFAAAARADDKGVLGWDPASGTCAVELPGKQQLGQKRDHRPLHYHTLTRASSRMRFSGGTAIDSPESKPVNANATAGATATGQCPADAPS
jgi:hypothetical protein